MDKQTKRPYAYRRWLLAAYWTVMFLATHWPKVPGLAECLRVFPHSDKVGHACLFAVWTALWWWLLAAGGRQVSKAAFNWLLLGGAAYAAMDELTQAFVGREPSRGDFAADLIGMVIVASICQYWQRKRSART